MIKPYRLFLFFALINFYLFGQDFFTSKKQGEITNDDKPQLIENHNINKPDSLKVSYKEKSSNKDIVSDNKKIQNNDSLETRPINKDRSIKNKKIARTKVQLTINTIPEKVDVFLDGSLIGKTPILGQRILSGNHIFEIRKDGFAPISYELNVNPSKSVNLDFFMNPVYNVKFKTDEVGLIFELNDDHRWTEDAIRMQLEAGDHQLRVYKLGEIVDEQIIVADQPLTFQYYLKRGVVIKP